MSIRFLRPNLFAPFVVLAIGTAVVLLLARGGSSYVLKLELRNASGLRSGSQVLLGGVPVGTVESLDLNRRNIVVADLHLDKAHVHMGEGAHASIVAANLLGEMYVALQPGNRARPLPSGTTLPESATIIPTQLDQIVDVLDDPTRARLAVLLDEAGRAVLGRRGDIKALLGQFPPSLTVATRLLGELVQDNHKLANVVTSSDHFITQIDTARAALKQTIAAAAGAVHTLTLRAADLRTSVAGAPRSLTTLVGFFGNAAQAFNSLARPAGEIANAAPWLDTVLARVKPVTQAAVPTLNRAGSVAPTLEQLAVQATPTLKQALPMLGSLQNTARLSRPLSTWLGLSSQDLFNILGGWSRAIQFRDGISHVFNGDVYLNPSIVLNIADQGASSAQRRQNLLDILNPAITRTLGLVSAENTARRASGEVGSVIKKLATGLTPHLPPAPPVPVRHAASSPAGMAGSAGSAPAPSGLSGLLDGLLGGLTKPHGSSGTGSGTPSTGTTSGGGSTRTDFGSGIRGLLSYLFGK